MKKRILALLIFFNFVIGTLVTQSVFADAVKFVYVDDVLFNDDFSNNLSKWSVDTTHSYRDLWKIDDSDGNKKLMWPSEYCTGSIYTGSDTWYNYTAEMTYTHNFYDSKTNIWQINMAVGYADYDNAYWLSWSTDRVKISRCKNGVWTSLADVKTYIKPVANTTYKLKVVSVNNILQLYINDDIAAQAYTDDRVFGKFAILASNIVGSFDDLYIKKTSNVSDIIIDNSDTDNFECVGKWSSSTTGGHYIKKDYLISKGVDDYKSSYAKWKLKLPQEGYYNVYMMWYPNNLLTTESQLEICYDGNVIDDKKQVNQTYSDGWNCVGSYYFNGEGDEYIKLYSSSVSEEYTVADAVMLHYIGSDISDNAYLNSSPEYMFEVKGSNQKFLYLDEDENDSTKCIIMPIDYFEPKEFDKNGSGKMNVNDSDNIAYYLNNYIKSELPASILNYIDKKHYSDDFSNNMEISLLSQDEYTKYADKVGICDSLTLSNQSISGWWLRTQNENQGKNIKYVVFDNMSGKIETASDDSTKVLGVRPIICIEKSFFNENFLNIDATGNYVKKIAGFNSSEVYLVNYSFTNYDDNYVGINSNLKNNKNAKLNAVVVNQGNQEETISLFCEKYVNNKLTEILPERKISLTPGERKEIIIDLGDCESGIELKVSFWNDMKLISKVLRPTEPSCYTAKIRDNSNYNVFMSNDAINFEIDTENDKVICEVEDYFGNTVCTKELNVSENNNFIAEVENGYFELYVKSGRGRILSKTSFAVIDNYNFDEVEDSDFGICTHFADKRPEWNFNTFKNLYLMGAKNIRDGCDWFTVEKTKGNVVVDAEPFKSLIEQYNMNFLFVSGYINKFYDDNMTPYTKEGYDGFANYITKSVAQFGNNLKYIDIYNEFYGKYGKYNNSPANSMAEYYYPLLNTSYNKIKETYPDIVCLSNAISGYNDWFDTLMASMETDNNYCADGFYCHPYFNLNIPEYALKNYIGNVKETMKSHTKDPNDEKSIWITETGANTINVSEKDQARYVPRAYAVAKDLNVEKIFWYDYIDDGTDMRNTENHYGFIRNGKSKLGSFVPKPSYVSYCVMTRKLTGAKFVKLDVTDGVYKAEFNKNGKKIYLIWALSSCEMQLNTDGNVIVTDIVGKNTIVNPNQGKISLEVSEDLIYVEGQQEITLTSDKYTVENEYISNIKENTNVETLLNNLETDGTIEIYNQNNEKIEGQAKIGTGMKLRLSDGKEYKLVVTGDLNGDGKVSITDLSKMKLHLIRKQVLENEYAKAIDMNKDGKYSVTDLSIIKKYIVNK